MANETKRGRKRAPPTRSEQKAETGAAVLEAARAEFERVGFEAASLRAIAQRAGVSAGTVLHHHADKRDLLHAALFDALDGTLTRACAALGEKPLEEELSGLAATVLRAYQRRPGLSRTLLKESLFADPPWSERFVAQSAAVHGALVALVRRAIERGELRSEVDAGLFALAWLASFQFALIAWVQGGHPKPLALIEHLTTHQLLGLRPAPSPSRRGSR